MKNITLSADEDLIRDARAHAQLQGRTLNDAFREWLQGLTRGTPTAEGRQAATEFDAFLEKTRGWDLGGPYTREELNERR